jgi:hypothetical protein
LDSRPTMVREEDEVASTSGGSRRFLPPESQSVIAPTSPSFRSFCRASLPERRPGPFAARRSRQTVLVVVFGWGGAGERPAG